ncbi:DUF885 domain-containing protein [Sphingomonas cavernae]|uniref:DUF885 domain-containing protein n=1 Tax=Sphingomonas cavernae TaxID=2320861 RepID=A0A418WP90_9SPHN|nr:DUF885 domain-containing protein [Sphingomonas cavernae]RJF93058.1 DUF885 domain-containing protein [Sphingomonas cavernae]
MVPEANNTTATEAVDASEWGKFVGQYLEGYFKLNPSFAVYQGRHEYDGKLPDWSAAGLKAQADYLKKTIADARAFDASTLSKEQQFERDYLIAAAEGELFWLEDADQPHRNPDFYISGLDPNVYIARPYADATTRMKAFIAFAKQVPAAAINIRANLKTPMPLSFIDFGKAGFQGLADYYVGDAKAAFAEVKDEALQKEFDAAAGAASEAMKDLAVWIESGRATATQDFALGPDKFARMVLKTEGVGVPIAELEKVGWADLRRNQAALKEACGTFAPGATIQACMAKMNAHKPEGGPVAGARKQLPNLKQFLIDKDLVSIPGTEEAQVEESPPYNRQNSAYIDIPGPYEKGLPSVYYISPPDPAWTKEVQNAYIPGERDLFFTSVHEVWPGHFLNFLHANRAKSLFGKVFVGYAFAEGWAHYSEEMMWDAGLGDGDAQTHVGQLSNALLRNCRYLSAIGLHAKGMTQDQSRQLFLTECYQDEGNARQQAARGTYDPAYLNYTMGKLMIRKLRDDWVADKGGRKAWKAFHDAFLAHGGPPIPLVRKAMLGGEAQAVF